MRLYHTNVGYTIWLFNIAMGNPQNKWRLRSLGKSSISMGHGFHGELLVITREGKLPWKMSHL